MTIKRFLLAAAVLLGLSSLRAEACTNIIITRAASTGAMNLFMLWFFAFT